MKFSKIVLAVAATLVAGQAFAAPVTQSAISAARTAGTLKEVWLAGSSAFTLPQFLAFEKLCDAGTTAIFDNATSGVKPGSTGNYSSYACTIGGTVNVLYNNNGGSALAYAAFLPATNALSSFKSTALVRLANLDTNTTCSTTAGGVYTHVELKAGSTVSTPVYGNCTLTTTPPTTGVTNITGGITDVEAYLFGISSLTGIGSEGNTNLGQTFGIVVTPALYRALQTAQGITEPGGNTETNFNYDPALAPSITREQYASISQGNLTSWQTGWSNLLGSSYANTPVYLVRRSSDSGTQAGSQAFFLGNPCNADNSGSITPASTGLAPNLWATPDSNSFTVYEALSTGNVKKMLSTVDLGGTITADDGTGTGTTKTITIPAGSFGIGVISLTEDWRAETAANTAQYRFIKIDGVSPEVGSQNGTATVTSSVFGGTTYPAYLANATVETGAYPYFMESRYFTQAKADAYSATLLSNIVGALDSPNTCALTPRAISTLSGISSCKTTNVVVTKGGNNCAIPTYYQ